MSKTILTNAFSAYKAQCEATSTPVVIDEFVFAYVPDQDYNAEINPNETLPDNSQIKGRYSITQKGMINPNAVIYSIILGTDIGSWDFNWIGLVNSKTNLVAAITHVKTQTKIKSNPANNTEGDTLTRNIITPYTNASTLTQITVTADVWQLDFNNRLTAIDERIRLDNIDNYGQTTFIQNAWLATMRNNVITLAPGTAYIAGLQCVNKQATSIDLTGVTLPKKAYLEASFTGTINSAWQTHVNIVIADSHPATRTENGVIYYSSEIATITTLSNITDLRILDWRTSHLEQNNDPHPQYIKKADLSNSLNAATTERSGIIELATQPDVNLGADAKKAITPSTLKAVTNSLEQKIDRAEEQFKRVATTTQFGLTKLATQQSVDNKTGITEVVTVETLNKPSLIASLQEYATNKANQVKEELFGGLPSATLDTFVEVGNALQQTGDAVAALFTKIGEKLDKTDKAADSSKLDGKTKTQIITEAQSGLATTESVNDIKTLADSKLGKWKQVATGTYKVPARNGRNVYIGTINTGYKGCGGIFDADRFRVYYRGYSVESGNLPACYWEVRCEIKSRIYWQGGGVICFDIYTGGEHIVSGYAGETWRLYELDA